MSFLIRSGANVNAVETIIQRTPLHYAAMNGDTNCMALLVANGADVNMKDWFQYTPLHRAARNGHTNCVALLVANGADVNVKNEGGDTPLLLAVLFNHASTVSYLINEVGVRITQYDEWTQDNIRRLLKEAETSTDRVDKHDKSPDSQESLEMILRKLEQAKANNKAIKVSYTTVLFSGSSGVGKTSLLSKLNKERLVRHHHSTGVAKSKHTICVKTTVVSKSTEGLQWVTLDYNSMISHLKQHLHNLTFPAECQKESIPGSTTSGVNKKIKLDIHTAKADEVSVDIAKADSSDVPSLGDVWNIINFLDTGGQPEFVNILPAVSCSIALTFVVFNLSESLGSLVRVQHNVNGDPSFDPYNLDCTNLEFIKCLMVSSENFNKNITPPLPSIPRHDGGNDSKICYVGTHALGLSDEMIQEIDGQLSTIATQLKLHQRSFWCSPKEKLQRLFPVEMFPVDTDKSSEDIIEDIRKNILFLAEGRDYHEVPITWLIFLLKLQKLHLVKKVSYISYQEADGVWMEENGSEDDVGTNLDQVLNEDRHEMVPRHKTNVHNILLFFHFMGMLFYYHTVKGICDYVFINRQWLFTKLTELVEIKFTKSYKKKEISPKHIEKFTMEGRLNISIINNLKIDLEGIEPLHFINLLDHLNIVACFDSEQKDYFMPCVLPSFTASVKKLNDELEKLYGETKHAPLLVGFKNGPMPHGFFCQLIVELFKNLPTGWHVPLLSTSKAQHVYNNLITFRTTDGHCISLFYKTGYIEVQVRHKEKEPGVIHNHIQSELDKALKNVSIHLQLNEGQLCYGFYCECEGNLQHFTELEDIASPTEYISCGYSDTKLTGDHKVWLKKTDDDPVTGTGTNLWTQEDLKVLVSKSTKEAISLPKDIEAKILQTVIVWLVTVNTDEILATLGYLQELDDYNCVYNFSANITIEQQSKEIIYYIGKYGDCPAAICDVSPSFNPYDSENDVSSITHELFPNLGAVISVGVAHGIAGKTKISDVLISSKVICINETMDELQTVTVSQQLTNIFDKPIVWSSQIIRKLSIYGYKPSVKSGIVFSCLFDNPSSIANKIDSDAIGIENGKANLFANVQYSGTNIVIVKAISDFGESSPYQPTAAVLAAYLVFKCLSSKKALSVLTAKKEALEMIQLAKDKRLTIKVRHAKILFCGAAHAGKTSFSRLLQGKPHIYDYKSTQFGETSQVLSTKVSVESSKWVVLDRKLETEKLMMYLRVLLQKSENQKEDEAFYNFDIASTVNTASSKATIEPVQSIEKTVTQTTGTKSNDQQWNDDVPEDQPFISVLNNQPSELPHAKEESSPLNDKLRLSVEKEMANLSTSELRDKIPDTWDLFTLLDTGGQPEFIKMLPAINDFAALTFVVLNMCKGKKCINDNVKAQYSCKDHDYPEHELKYTNKELIECLLSSVRSATTVQERKFFSKSFIEKIVVPGDNKHPNPKPVVCFIGTHADEVSGIINVVVDCIDKEISELDIMKNTENKPFITWCDILTKKLIIPIDNRTIENVESSDIQRNTSISVNNIHDESNKLLDEKTQYEIPISWFILELEIRKYCKINKVVCLRMNKIKVICDQIMPTNKSMKIEMIKEVMKFYHTFGTLLYFHEVKGFNDIVITDPQWLFNNLTKIITCKFDKNLHSSTEICDMVNKGICTENLLGKVTLDLCEDVKISSFLELLVYLKVIAPINNCQYFIPSVLRTRNDEIFSGVKSGEQYGKAVAYKANEEVEIEPLFITSKFGTIPRGLFAFLIVELLQRHPEFHSKNNPSNNSYYCFADLITFRIDPWWYFTLTDKISYLMLQVRVKRKNQPSYHHQVQNYVTKALEIVCDHFDWSLNNFRYGFLCKECPNKHPSLLVDEVPISSITYDYTKCMDDEIMDLKTEQRIWFENVDGYLQQNDVTNIGSTPIATKDEQIVQSGSLYSVPTMRDLVILLKGVSDWKTFGYCLLPVDKEYLIEIINKNNSTVDSCKTELYQEFLKCGSRVATWERVINALKEPGQLSIAEQVEKQIVNMKITQ